MTIDHEGNKKLCNTTFNTEQNSKLLVYKQYGVSTQCVVTRRGTSLRVAVAVRWLRARPCSPRLVFVVASAAAPSRRHFLPAPSRAPLPGTPPMTNGPRTPRSLPGPLMPR